MSYSVDEYVCDCERAVLCAKLIAKHYPKARREQIGGNLEWSDERALANATGFSVEVVDKGEDKPKWDRFNVTLYPYHELREGEIVVRVYAAGWCERTPSWDFMSRLRARKDLHDAVLAMLKEPK